MPLTIVCIAKSNLAAHRILHALRNEGIDNHDVSVLFADTTTTGRVAHELPGTALDGAAARSSSGGILGGVMGWLVGLRTITLPGIGPFIAAGPILAALGGAVVGGVTGTLVVLGIPEIEAAGCEAKVRDGAVMISVAAADHRTAYGIRTLLRKAGAEDIATSVQVSSHSSGHSSNQDPRRERRSDALTALPHPASARGIPS